MWAHCSDKFTKGVFIWLIWLWEKIFKYLIQKQGRNSFMCCNNMLHVNYVKKVHYMCCVKKKQCLSYSSWKLCIAKTNIKVLNGSWLEPRSSRIFTLEPEARKMFSTEPGALFFASPGALEPSFFGSIALDPYKTPLGPWNMLNKFWCSITQINNSAFVWTLSSLKPASAVTCATASQLISRTRRTKWLHQTFILSILTGKWQNISK